MQKERYNVVANETFTGFSFSSDGAKGSIPKMVTYQQLGGDTYNLAFGDWNMFDRTMDDLSRTNNGDTEKVLATVAFTTLTFFKHHPNSEVFLKGSTIARTRLYQIGIVRNLKEITDSVIILGLIDKIWESFVVGKN